MKLRKLLIVSLLFGVMSLVLVSCELGSSPVGSSTGSTRDSLLFYVPVDSVTSNMRIFVSPSEVRASNTDSALVSVVVFDDNHNPIADRPVYFTATAGIITAVDSTDESGTAYATFRSVPVNTDAKIVAYMPMADSNLVVATRIKLTGATVFLSAEFKYALVNEEVAVDMIVLDGAGTPVPDAAITISGAMDTIGSTQGDGTFSTKATQSSQGTKQVVATSIGASDTVSISYWIEIPSGTIDTVGSIRSLRLFSSRSQIKSNNSDEATITAILSDENNNPMSGERILFSCNLGIIDKSASVDTNGRASVTLRSSPVNGVCRIVAEVENQPEIKDSISIIFSGITLELIPDVTEVSVNDTTRVDVIFKDASGNPIGGDEVKFSITSSIGTFDNGLNNYSATLDPTGRTSVYITSATAGNVEIQAAGLNTRGNISIKFVTNNLTLSASDTAIQVGGNDSAQITATYKDDSNQPVSGITILFATNAGEITLDSATTNSSGQASTWIKSSNFAGEATIQAHSADRSTGTRYIKVKFLAQSPAYITLAITPDNIGINGGIADLVATVKDSNLNMVSGADVGFKILEGPGGGEYIQKPVVASYNGTARSKLLAGSQPSMYRACKVVAYIGDIADTSKLTISGEPHIITIARPEDDTLLVPNAGEMDKTVFSFFVGAVVQDINGNPVADGTKVQFSAVVSGLAVERKVFMKWAGVSSADEVKPVFKYYLKDIPFEDINNNGSSQNGAVDPGIDLDLDGNPNIASRGEDVDGDGEFEYDPTQHDYFFDFNGNGQCDVTVGEFDTITVNGIFMWADLNNNGRWDTSELLRDNNNDGIYDPAPSGDFPFNAPSAGRLPNGLQGWETRLFYPYFEFTNNDFAVVIEASVVTKDGVAQTQITYPRQFARRLYVTVNSEANGKRDKDGERFVLPVIREN